MIDPGDDVLVAVSGGADSVALLICLERLAAGLHVNLSVAHFNHRLRGEEADADEELVRRLSADLKLPFVSESWDGEQNAVARKKNLEEAAREARYEFLRRTAAQRGAQKIALGHTLNDQAETVLMRLIRGSGTQGLAGIYPILDNLFIRPLVECRRSQVLEYVQMRNARYNEDSTNSDLRYQRNRIRHELIPYLAKRFNPKILYALGRQAAAMREVQDFASTYARRAYQDLRVMVAGGISLPVSELSGFPPALQKMIVRNALEECVGSLKGIIARHIEDILMMCRPGQSGRRIQLPRKVVAARQFDRLTFLRDCAPQKTYSYDLPLPGRQYVAEAGMEFEASISLRQDLQLVQTPQRVFLDAGSLPQSLTIRSRLPGDRYGGAGRRKVKKMLIDAKIPVEARGTLPMVVARDVVVWIPGFLPPKSFTLPANSDRCVVLEARARRM